MTPKNALDLKDQPATGALDAAGGGIVVAPTPQELAVLTKMERLSVRLVARMNRGRWKAFWTTCQRYLGSLWIYLATNNLTRVYGWENIEAISPQRPLLLVANHRSFFDMYVVSALMYRRTDWIRALYFPVRGRFFYESPLGWFVNLVMGWWSMYPPFFAEGEKREFDKYSLRVLTELCRTGPGNVIGFHPEGTRNKSGDPYSFLRAQPGVGKLIKDSGAQVVPVFIAGLGNQLPRQVLGNWTGGQPIRVHFGEQINFEEFIAKRDSVRTYKEITDLVMGRIADLGQADRQEMAKSE
ncbi:MAG: lysophospholipid acyltransferase family protein [Pyrinomonadaceae bacterium]